MLLPIHVVAGGLAIVLGAVALLVKKGGTIHRRSGLLFVAAMLVMGISASLLGYRRSPTDPNVFAGFMTAYFVGTALTTVRPVSPWTRSLNVAALPVPVGLALGGIARGVQAFNSPDGFLNGVPFVMHLSRRSTQGLQPLQGVGVLPHEPDQGGRLFVGLAAALLPALQGPGIHAELEGEHPP